MKNSILVFKQAVDNLLEKQKVAYHKHDGFQEHPVAVKHHQEYFSSIETKPGASGRPKLTSLESRQAYKKARRDFDEATRVYDEAFARAGQVFSRKTAPEDYDRAQQIYDEAIGQAKQTYAKARHEYIEALRAYKAKRGAVPIENDERVRLSIEKMKANRKIWNAWNKGLTKETDFRVMKYSQAQKGKVVSDEFRAVMSLKN